MAAPLLDLQGGSGEKSRIDEASVPQTFVYDPTPEKIAAMDDATLADVYGAMLEHDASGGRVTRKLRREIDRRALSEQLHLADSGRASLTSVGRILVKRL